MACSVVMAWPSAQAPPAKRALEPLRQGIHQHFGSDHEAVASGLALRHDHDSQFLSHAFKPEPVPGGPGGVAVVAPIALSSGHHAACGRPTVSSLRNAWQRSRG